MDRRSSFYKRTIDKWVKNRDVNILIVGGGNTDREVFRELGFVNVTISNLDERMKGSGFYPFNWSYQDAENLSFQDNSFDFAIIHMALHHCSSPHRALLDMYRVAKQGVILFESRDSFTMRLALYLGLAQNYEHAAVFYNDCKYGGVGNTNIPNFVYRWTEPEVEKTINSYAPYAKHNFYYSYGYDLPSTGRLRRKVSLGNIFRYFPDLLSLPFTLFRLFYFRLLPKQQNLFACFIKKPDLEEECFEWLKYENGKFTFNKEWADNYYR